MKSVLITLAIAVLGSFNCQAQSSQLDIQSNTPTTWMCEYYVGDPGASTILRSGTYPISPGFSFKANPQSITTWINASNGAPVYNFNPLVDWTTVLIWNPCNPAEMIRLQTGYAGTAPVVLYGTTLTPTFCPNNSFSHIIEQITILGPNNMHLDIN